MGMEFTNNNSKRVLLPLETDLSNMSDPNVAIDLTTTGDRTTDITALQTFLYGSISRRDQSRSKHKSQKRRKRRSSFTSSPSRSASSDSRKEAESLKYPKKKILLHYLIISPMIMADTSSPLAAQNLSILQPAEKNVQTILQILQHYKGRVQTQKLKPGPLIGQSMKFSGFCLRSLRPIEEYAPAKPLSGIEHFMESHATPLLLLPQSKLVENIARFLQNTLTQRNVAEIGYAPKI